VFIQYIREIDLEIQNILALICNLKDQIGQLSTILLKRISQTLSSNTITNPKQHVKAISLRIERKTEWSQTTSIKQLVQQLTDQRARNSKKNKEAL